jgi:hypothetical protein
VEDCFLNFRCRVHYKAIALNTPAAFWQYSSIT